MATKRVPAPKKRSPHCNECGKAIRVPQGWSHGAAVRRHYWAKHPEAMRKTKDVR